MLGLLGFVAASRSRGPDVLNEEEFQELRAQLGAPKPWRRGEFNAPASKQADTRLGLEPSCGSGKNGHDWICCPAMCSRPPSQAIR